MSFKSSSRPGVVELKLMSPSGLKGRTFMGHMLERLLDHGFGFDGSSTGFAPIEDSDMLAMPCEESMVVLPENVEGRETILMMCDVFQGGKPSELSSRYILHRIVDELKSKGLECYVGVEPEMYLFRKNSDGLEAFDDAGYMDVSPEDKAEEFKKGLTELLYKIGFNVIFSHHEVGPGQQEVVFEFDEPLRTADNLMLYKEIVRKYARGEGLEVTFMPKPLSGKAGNGLHVHMSLFKDGRNMFYDGNSCGYISEYCKYFIAGILRHAMELSFIVSPTINSYKRLVPGHEAPVYICWGFGNRSALIRVPNYCTDEKSMRIELRCPDSSCDPYLAFACVIAAGMEGVRKRLEPPQPVERNVYTAHEGLEELPRSLEDAIEIAEGSEFLRSVLGEGMLKTLIEIKRRECADYTAYLETTDEDLSDEITGWELRRYFNV